jgi:hypothetical protein
MAPLAFVLALVLVGVGTIILAGLAGGYLIYRRAGAALPAPMRSLEAGDRLPLRLTGIVRTSTGLEHLREAPADLVRFALGRRVPQPEESPFDAGAIDAHRAPESTLIVERRDVPQGVAVGLGELRRVSSGQVMTFQAPRPALRVVAGTGPLFLSFDSEAERDRAAAELLHESDLGPDGTRIEPS